MFINLLKQLPIIQFLKYFTNIYAILLKLLNSSIILILNQYKLQQELENSFLTKI
jgi:hypothetical protein